MRRGSGGSSRSGVINHTLRVGWGLVAGRKAISVDRTGLAQLDAAEVHFAGVFFGALDAGGDAGQGFEPRGGDGRAAKAAKLVGWFLLFAHGDFRQGMIRIGA